MLAPVKPPEFEEFFEATPQLRALKRRAATYAGRLRALEQEVAEAEAQVVAARAATPGVSEEASVASLATVDASVRTWLDALGTLHQDVQDAVEQVGPAARAVVWWTCVAATPRPRRGLLDLETAPGTADGPR